MVNITESKNKHELVMIVDDSSIDNFVNKKIMQRYEFTTEVIEFSKARSALKYLLDLNNNTEERIPSLLFLDLDMPEIDGFEFLDEFNLLSEQLKKMINIIILTSSINPTDVERCSKYNSVLTFLHKPLMKNNLEAIELILSQKKRKN